jgi:hypothetical protein
VKTTVSKRAVLRGESSTDEERREAEEMVECLKTLNEAAEQPGNWRVAARLLEWRYPHIYGRPSRVQRLDARTLLARLLGCSRDERAMIAAAKSSVKRSVGKSGKGAVKRAVPRARSERKNIVKAPRKGRWKAR